MKKVKDFMLESFSPASDQLIKMDVPQVIDLQCRRCGEHMRIPEMYATERSIEEFEHRYDHFKRALEYLGKAVDEIYGEDPRNILFALKVQEIYEEFDIELEPSE